MKKTIAATAVFALCLVGVTFAMSGSPKTGAELRRVDCQSLTMFTPAHRKSADELCANYGGVAQKNAAPTDEGLVILVRNQPAGGFIGGAGLQ